MGSPSPRGMIIEKRRYNGAKFDLEYVAERGRLYGLNFSSVLTVFAILTFIGLLNGLKLICRDMIRNRLKDTLGF